MVDSPDELARIKQSIIAKEFKDALNALDSFIGQESPPPDALYMQAVCYRYTNQLMLALDSLDKLKKVCPDHGRAHQEEGHTYRT